MSTAIVVGLAWLGLSVVGGWIGGQTGRGVAEGAILGVLLGPLGLLIALLLPRPEAVPPPRRREPRPERLSREDLSEILRERQQDEQVAGWLRSPSPR